MTCSAPGAKQCKERPPQRPCLCQRDRLRTRGLVVAEYQHIALDHRVCRQFVRRDIVKARQKADQAGPYISIQVGF